ncbi:MAG: hypothetical protein ACT4OV_09335, partial [Microthrixaceae bacterium]
VTAAVAISDAQFATKVDALTGRLALAAKALVVVSVGSKAIDMASDIYLSTDLGDFNSLSPGITLRAAKRPSGAETVHPREFLESFFDSWLRGDSSELSAYGPPGVINPFLSEFPPGDFDSYRIVWSDTCLQGSSGAGGCEVLLVPKAGGYASILFVGYLGAPMQLTELTAAGDAG